MALSELQQAQKVINKGKRIMLVVPEKPSLDAVASMIALYLTLQDQGIEHLDEISPSHVPRNLQFLPGSSQIKTTPQTTSDIVVDIAGPTTIESVTPHPNSGGIRLHITLPQNQSITHDNIQLSIRSMPYDVVVTCGATDLEELGDIFTNHADFFYNTPIINIDHRAANESFGTVNIVDITASSTSEITYEFIKTINKEDISADIATALYAGIVAGTDAFQKPSTSPRAFHVAANLLENKANREAVIENLVKTKPLNILKLSGRVYARLRHIDAVNLFYSTLRPIDFQDSGAKPSDIATTLNELANNIAGFSAAFILNENNASYNMHILLGAGLQQKRKEIQEKLEATRDENTLIVKINANSIESAEEQALIKLKGILN